MCVSKVRLKGDLFKHEKGTDMFIDCSDIDSLRTLCVPDVAATTTL